MDRVFESGAAGLAPAAPASPSSGFPTGGNPSGGVPATKPGPYWFHMVTEELRAVIVAAGLTPDHLALNQLALAISTLVASAGVSAYNGTQVLPATDVRKTVLFSGGTANATFTLPALSGVALGSSITIKHTTTGSFVLTVQRAGTDVIQPGGSPVTSFTMLVGDSVTLINSGSGWAIVNGSAMLQYATGAPLLGVNQSWQNVLPSRAANTDYTNTTGAPIAVAIDVGNAATNSDAVLIVGGRNVGRFRFILSSGALTQQVSLFAVVQPGVVYRLNTSAITISSWEELRR